MAEPVPVELAQKVIAEKAAVMGGATASDALVGKTINALKDNAREASLNIAANRESNIGIQTGLREASLGFIDATGTRQVDAARDTRTRTRQELYDEFSKKSFDALTTAQKNLLLDDASEAIKNLPGMASHFASLPAGTNIDVLARQAAEDRLKTDPSFKKAITDLFLERTDPAKPIEDKVTAALAKEAELKKQRDALESQNDNLKNEVSQKERRLKEHQVHIPGRGGGREGTVYREILTLKADVSTKQSEIDSLDTDITQLNAELSGLTDELRISQAFATGNTRLPAGTPTPRSVADINSEITAKKTEITTSKSDLNRKRGEMEEGKKKVDSLEAERTKLEDTLDALKKEQKKAEDDFNKVDGAYTSQQAEVRKLQAVKVLTEEAWVQSLESITKEATITYINKELNDALAKVKTLQEERVKETNAGGKKKFFEYEKDQYIGLDGKPNKAVIRADRLSLMRAGADVVLTIGTPPHTTTETLHNLDGAEQTLVDVMRRGAMNDTEIFDLLKDPATRSEMAGTLAKDILTTYLWSGQKLTRAEVIRIGRSDWGKGMVDKAIAGRADLQAQIDNAIGKGVLNWKENLKGQLGKLEWGKFLLILLIIAGVIGGIGFLKR